MWIWQLWPLYLLILAAGLYRWRFRRTLLALLGVVSIAAWAVLPFPWIPKPPGPHPVGTKTYRWIDESREELSTDDPNDKRAVIVQLFYPAPAGTAGDHSVYIDGLRDLPPKVSGVPRFFLHSLAYAETHSVVDAPLAGRTAPWPVILFSPGYGAPRAFYTALITNLASRGNVVLAIDHPYEAGVAELPDGRVVGNVVRDRPEDPDRIVYMQEQQAIRVADMRFVLDRVAQLPQAEHLDLSAVAAVGHSFGGASSMAAMQVDPRISAAMNLDGTPYGTLRDAQLRGPVLWVQGDPARGRQGKLYLDGNTAIVRQAKGGSGYHVMLRGTSHLSFTDAPRFLSPLGNLILRPARPADDVTEAVIQLLEQLRTAPANLPRHGQR